MAYSIQDINGVFEVVPSDKSATRFEGDLATVDSPWGEIALCGFKTPDLDFFRNGRVPGNYCGYVKLPEGHPWLTFTDRFHGDLNYDRVSKEACQNPLMKELVGGAGELTFANNEGWIGFDTAHLIDKSIDWTPELLLSQILTWAQIVGEA